MAKNEHDARELLAVTSTNINGDTLTCCTQPCCTAVRSDWIQKFF
jgi:hypothetical protein